MSTIPSLAADKRTELAQLFQEFLHHYLPTAAGRQELASFQEVRQAARANYWAIITQAQRHEDVSDAVLLKLLPHADSPTNRWRGAWIFPASASKGDLRTRYEAAGLIQPAQWPTVATAILEFVQQCVESPRQLVAACQTFAELPTAKGFQSGLLTPILNALRPEDYGLLSNKIRSVLNYFTDNAYSPALTDYPAANATLHKLYSEIAPLLAENNSAATNLADLFATFCHWLIDHKQFPLRTSRCWALALEEDGWLWEEWREGAFVAMGWDELGDLTSLSKAEFQAHRDSLIAQYRDWSKRSVEQVWRFTRQIQEGDRLLVHTSEQTVLGIGVVTGPYYYVADLPYSHRRAVEWETVTPRRFDTSGWRGVLQEVDPAMLAAVMATPAIPEEMATPKTLTPDDKTVTLPAFVRFFAPIVEMLQAFGGAAPAHEVVEQVLSNLPPSETQRASPRQRSQWQSQVQRARHCLGQAGLLEATLQGVWRLTERGLQITVTPAMERTLFEEVEYQRRIEYSLHDESPTIQALAEAPVPYTVSLVTAPEATPETMPETTPVTIPPIVERLTRQPIFTLADCAQATFLPEETLAQWVAAIERKGQAIFYGPPGVGKTFLAEQLARYLVSGSDGFVDMVQFHPAYAYEDFVQGIRPQSGGGAQLEYPIVPGRFLEFCQRAAHCTGRSVLIIDEINRANLARVFGELMVLLEYRERSVRLAADGQPFAIPANVRLLGTMNTADRSIALVDHALRRRFAFIALQPNYSVLERYHAQHKTSFPVAALVHLLQRLNNRIGDPHYQLGISFFLRPHLSDELANIWQTEIEPYLEEYFFDQPEQMQAWRWSAIHTWLVN